MAGTAVSRYSEEDGHRLGKEVFLVTQSENDTTVITPTKIKEILSVKLTANEAVAAANIAAFHLTSFIPGAPTVTITSLDVASNFTGAILLVEVEGKIG